MKRYVIRIVGLAALLSFASSHGAIHQFGIPLIDGPQHGTPSPATGSGTFSYDDVTHEITWNITWSGLSGLENILAFHGPAPPGVRADGQVDIRSIVGISNPTVGETTVTPEQGEEILAGLWYFDIHTALFPQGEIRGQIYLDSDFDGAVDIADNCSLLGNADQRDTDADGIGNACDSDLNQDCAVNFVDLGLFKSVFLTSDETADFNGDGGVNFLDLSTLKASFLQEPGPSGVANICDTNAGIQSYYAPAVLDGFDIDPDAEPLDNCFGH